MHCPYCSIEYSPENVCFCLPSMQDIVSVVQQPCRELQTCDALQLFADEPLWSQIVVVQPLAMSGLA